MAIVIVEQNLGNFVANTNNHSVSLTPPVLTEGCTDTNMRTIMSINNGIALYKDLGLETESVPLVGDTFLPSSILTFNIESLAVGEHTIFTYKAIGTCGESNTVAVKINVVNDSPSDGGGSSSSTSTTTAPQVTANTGSNFNIYKIIYPVLGGVFLILAGWFIRKRLKRKNRNGSK